MTAKEIKAFGHVGNIGLVRIGPYSSFSQELGHDLHDKFSIPPAGSGNGDIVHESDNAAVVVLIMALWI